MNQGRGGSKRGIRKVKRGKIRMEDEMEISLEVERYSVERAT